MTDFSKTNIHCSSIGNIMGVTGKKTNLQKWEDANSKYLYWKAKYDCIEFGKRLNKSAIDIQKKYVSYLDKANELELCKNDDPLSVGAKSHLKKVYGYAKYGKWSASKDKGNKYLNKGKIAENDSIELINKTRGVILSKNEERVDNDFLTGIPDLFLGSNILDAEYIIDVKTSWDIETFMDNLGKPLAACYWWQIQGYLAITGAKVGEVAYCLVNTPQSILNEELYKLQRRLDVVTDEDPLYKLEALNLVNNMTFDEIPGNARVIRFLVERDDDAIEKIYKKVIKCREYLVEIEELHSQGVFLAKEQPAEKEIEEINEDSEEISTFAM